MSKWDKTVGRDDKHRLNAVLRIQRRNPAIHDQAVKFGLDLLEEIDAGEFDFEGREQLLPFPPTSELAINAWIDSLIDTIDVNGMADHYGWWGEDVPSFGLVLAMVLKGELKDRL